MATITSLKLRCCRKILRTKTSGFMGGRLSIRSRTKPAATGPFATSKLMSKSMLLCTSTNLMMGTFALATTCNSKEAWYKAKCNFDDGAFALAGTVTSVCKQYLFQGILDVRTMQLVIKHYILIAVVPPSKGNLIHGQICWEPQLLLQREVTVPATAVAASYQAACDELCIQYQSYLRQPDYQELWRRGNNSCQVTSSSEKGLMGGGAKEVLQEKVWCAA